MPNQAFPATLFWGDKLQALGAVYLVAEALVRSILMSSDEFVDRVAWVVVERMVGSKDAPSRGRALTELRRQLSEIRSTHASFHTVADASIIHGAVLVLLRVTHLAALSAEFAASPYGYTLDRHVQDMVFLCDFAAMVLGKIQLGSSGGDHHEPMVEHREGMPALWMPAHYANEAMVRGLAPLDVLRAVESKEAGEASAAAAHTLNATVARSASRLLQENAQAISNAWLSRNLLRLALGYKTVAAACEQQTRQLSGASGEATATSGAAAAAAAASTSAKADGSDELGSPFGSTLLLAAEKEKEKETAAVDKVVPFACRASVQEILRERAVAIQAWTQRHGIDTSAVFLDPLYRVEVELWEAR